VLCWLRFPSFSQMLSEPFFRSPWWLVIIDDIDVVIRHGSYMFLPESMIGPGDFYEGQTEPGIGIPWLNPFGIFVNLKVTRPGKLTVRYGKSPSFFHGKIQELNADFPYVKSPEGIFLGISSFNGGEIWPCAMAARCNNTTCAWRIPCTRPGNLSK